MRRGRRTGTAACLAVLGALLVGLGATPTSAKLAKESSFCLVNPVPGINKVVGTPGNDVIRGTSGNDLILGKGGNDRIVGRGGIDVLCGGPGDDVIITSESTSGHDSDFIVPGSGNDTVIAGGGAIVLYSDAPRGIDVDLANGNVRGGSGRDTLRGVQTVDGTPFDDTMHGAKKLTGGSLDGEGGNDTLSAGSGGNDLDGGSGDDHLIGGPLSESLKGGDGDDTIVAKGDPEGFCYAVGGCTYDTVDCGPGHDVTSADPKDHVSACEVVHRK